MRMSKVRMGCLRLLQDVGQGGVELCMSTENTIVVVGRNI